MNNSLRIMSISEDEAHRVVLVRPQEEGGINFIYNPETDSFTYQVFIHSELPLLTSMCEEFADFAQARSFASKLFKQDWELLSWDQKAQRPCETGEHECGSGSCETCKSNGGGCSSCGAQDDQFHQAG